MSVQQVMNAVIMLTVMILMVATGVSAGQDSREMDITVQVSLSECTNISIILLQCSLYIQISMNV